MPDARKRFGNASERLAASFLKSKGMRILAHQYTTRIGEIDLIARDGDEIVFVEVKARRSSTFGYPEESVTPAKLEKISQVGEQYLRAQNQAHVQYRIDVIAIEQDEDPPKFTHFVGV